MASRCSDIIEKQWSDIWDEMSDHFHIINKKTDYQTIRRNFLFTNIGKSSIVGKETRGAEDL